MIEHDPLPRIAGVSWHAQERFRKRYGYLARAADWRAAVLSIVERTALLTSSTAGAPGRERWRIRVGDVECDVIWCFTGATIITVLPPGSVFRNPLRGPNHRPPDFAATVSRAYRRARHADTAEDWG